MRLGKVRGSFPLWPFSPHTPPLPNTNLELVHSLVWRDERRGTCLLAPTCDTSPTPHFTRDFWTHLCVGDVWKQPVNEWASWYRGNADRALARFTYLHAYAASLPPSHTPSHTPRIHIHSTHSLTHSLTLTHSLSLSHSLSHTRRLAHTHITHTHTHTHHTPQPVAAGPLGPR